MRRQQTTQSGTYLRPELIRRLWKPCGHVAGNHELAHSCVNVSMVCSRWAGGGRGGRPGKRPSLYSSPYTHTPSLSSILGFQHHHGPSRSFPHSAPAPYSCTTCTPLTSVYNTTTGNDSPHGTSQTCINIANILWLLSMKWLQVQELFSNFHMLASTGLLEGSFKAGLCSGCGSPRDTQMDSLSRDPSPGLKRKWKNY